MLKVVKITVLILVLTSCFLRKRDSGPDNSLGEFDSVDSGLSDEEKLADLLNWEQRNLGEPAAESQYPISIHEGSPAERTFKAELNSLRRVHKLQFCYNLNSYGYFFEHVMPLFHVWPAPFCGNPSNLSVSNAKRLIAQGHPKANFYLFRDETFLHRFHLDGRFNYFWTLGSLYKDVSVDYPPIGQLPHGVDTDQVWYGQSPTPARKDDYPAVIFSKYSMNGYTAPDEIRKFYQVDPKKKTVLYLATAGEWEFLDNAAPQFMFQHTLDALVALQKNYNVVISVHPIKILEDDYLRLLRQHFTIAPAGTFKSFVTFYSIADVVISSPAAGGSVATAFADIPLVILRPIVSYGTKLPMGNTANQYGDLAFSENNAMIITDQDILDSGTPIVSAVEKVLPASDPHRIAGRKEFFRYYYGCIDGYEEYRSIIIGLKRLQLDTTNLEKAYREFPPFAFPGMTIYNGSSCPI